MEGAVDIMEGRGEIMAGGEVVIGVVVVDGVGRRGGGDVVGVREEVRAVRTRYRGARLPCLEMTRRITLTSWVRSLGVVAAEGAKSYICH